MANVLACGSSHCGSVEMNPLVSMRMQIRSLALLSGLRTLCCCELWCKLVAAAPIWPLAWQLPYAAGAALKSKKKKTTKQKTNKQKKQLLCLRACKIASLHCCSSLNRPSTSYLPILFRKISSSKLIRSSETLAILSPCSFPYSCSAPFITLAPIRCT